MKKIAIKFAVILVAFLLVGAATDIYTDIFGNPLSKQKSENNIISYIIDNYATNNFSVSDIVYDRENKEYGAVIEFTDSEDSVFYVAYSPKDNMIKDTYIDNVASGYNTFIRLNAEYGRIVSNALSEYYTDDNVMYYGELGKNTSLSDYSNTLYPDMPFDMYNLPLEATVSLFADSEDTSANRFAYDLSELQKLMYYNDIAVDYYDIMYNGTVLLEDFPSAVVVEYLEDTEGLAEKVEEYLNK